MASTETRSSIESNADAAPSTLISVNLDFSLLMMNAGPEMFSKREFSIQSSSMCFASISIAVGTFLKVSCTSASPASYSLIATSRWPSKEESSRVNCHPGEGRPVMIHTGRRKNEGLPPHYLYREVPPSRSQYGSSCASGSSVEQCGNTNRSRIAVADFKVHIIHGGVKRSGFASTTPVVGGTAPGKAIGGKGGAFAGRCMPPRRCSPVLPPANNTIYDGPFCSPECWLQAQTLDAACRTQSNAPRPHVQRVGQAVAALWDEDDTLVRYVSNRIDCLLQCCRVVGDAIAFCAETIVRKINGGLIFQAGRVKGLCLRILQNGSGGQARQQ
jgi:hypothetical protein